jgi:hypothetical protein
MAVKHLRGPAHIEWFIKPVSTAFALNDMVTILSTAAGDGTISKVTSSSTAIYGLIQRDVLATDADYAVAGTLVPVLIPDSESEFLFLATGTAAQTDIGEYIDATDHLSVNVAAYTVGVVRVTAVPDATHVIGKIVKKSGVAVAVTA